MNGLNIRAAFRVAWKDIRILLQERGMLVYLFALPIAFILAFAGAAGRDRDPEQEAITLAVVNLDEGSGESGTLLEALDEGGVRCELYDEEEAQAKLDKGSISRLMIIPADYGTNLQAGTPVTLRLVNGAGASVTQSEAVHRIVAGVAADLSLETQFITAFRQMADMEASAPPEQRTFTGGLIVEQAQSQIERSKTEPLLAVEEGWPEHLLEGEEDINPLSVTVPGFGVLFIFLTAQTTAQSIYEERKVGSFRRLLAAPISRGAILVGKMMPNFITGLAQTVVLFGAGVYVLPLLGFDPMTLGNDALALVLVCLMVVLCSTSLGVFIAAISRTEGQISGVSAVVLWVFGFAALLIAEMPPGSFLDTIRQVIPHSWAMTAFLDLFLRGKGLADIMPSIYPLLGFSVGFFAIGLWRFKFD
jgi:ABC-2 type transport system permease protein